VLDYRRGVREINCWSKQHPMALPEMVTFPGKTDKGLAMEASREQIIAIYGQPDKTELKGPFETLRYDTLRTEFMLIENRLVNIKIRAPQ